MFVFKIYSKLSERTQDDRTIISIKFNYLFSNQLQ